MPDYARSDTGQFAQVPIWLLPLVSSRAIQVYAALSAYADFESGECWPSHSRLAGDLKTSVTTIKRAINELVENNALLRHNRKKEDGSYSSNFYTVIRAKEVGSKSDDLSTEMNPPPSKNDPRGGVINEPITITTSLTKTNERELRDAQKTIPDLIYEPIGKIKPKSTEWQELFKAVCDACSMDLADMTKTAQGEVGAAAKQIWDVGGRSQDIALRAECYKVLFKKTVVTPSALAKHWPKCTPTKVEEDIANSPERERLMAEYSNKNRFAHLEQKAINQ